MDVFLTHLGEISCFQHLTQIGLAKQAIHQALAVVMHLQGVNNMSKSDTNNHANQLNPNHDAFWQSRGYDERPEDWEVQAGLI